jgi:hypothetical protein
MQDNPFLKNEEAEVVDDNPFVKESEVINTTKEEVKQIENKTVEETSNTKGTTEIASNSNQGVRAYTGDEAVSYGDVITFDTDVKLNIVDKFTLSKDQKSVIAFVLFDKRGAPQLRYTQTYYDEPSKTMFRAPKNKPLLMKVAGKLGEPKIRFATIILRYLTDNSGNLLRPASGQRTYDLLAYVFSTDKFPQFKEIHKRWDLKKYDVLLTCSDEKYQKISIIPDSECRYRANPAMAKSIITEAREMFDKGLNRFLGKQLKDEEILAMIEDGPVNNEAIAGGSTYNPFTNTESGGAVNQVGNEGNSADFSNLVQGPGDVKAESGSPF